MSRALSDQLIHAAAELLSRRTGLAFPEPRRRALAGGLTKGMEHAGIRDPDTYLSRLTTDSALFDEVVGEITVGETYFFREPEQLAVIRDEVLPLLRREVGDRALRIWSAGCATGEEPYTLAMLALEAGVAAQAHILATDVSRTALDRARRARYTQWSFRSTPSEVRVRYFREEGGRFELVPQVRALVEFRYLNLAEDVYPSLATGVWGMDLIVCRNVLIYFDRATTIGVARRLLDSLSEGGWLLLGASDPPLSEWLPCEVLVTRAGLAYRRAGRKEPARAVVTEPPEWESPSSGGAPVPPITASSLPLSLPTPPAPLPGPHEEAAAERDVSSALDAEQAARCYAAHDYTRAAVLASGVVRRDGGDPEQWVLLVRALANQGRLEDAGRALASALDRHRTSAELSYLQAVLLAEAGRPREAADAARRALYLDRKLVVAHLALGAALARVGDLEGARRAFRNAARDLAGRDPGAIVEASDGEPVGRLAEMARVQLNLVSEAAA